MSSANVELKVRCARNLYYAVMNENLKQLQCIKVSALSFWTQWPVMFHWVH